MKLNFDPKIILQREGFGNINYQGTLPGGAATFTGANNGVSISSITPGTVVLGQDSGQAGSPGKLLSNREIPLNGFSLSITGTGSGLGVVFNLVGAAGKAANLPYLVTLTSGFAENGRLNFVGTDLYLGRLAGSNNTVAAGSNNTGIGQNALQALTNGASNTAVGSMALSSLSTASSNTAVGFAALKVSNGISNTAVGHNALTAITTGTTNTAIGDTAGNTLIAGIRNTLIGAGAGQNNTVDFSNCVAIGVDTMDNTGGTIGVNNVMVGNGNYNIGAIPIGQDNIVVGSFNTNATGTGIGNANVIIGNGIATTPLTANSIILLPQGTLAVTIPLPNVIILGDNTQHTIIGQAIASYSDNGSYLQVAGSISLPILVTAVSVTLTNLNFSVVFTASGTATLPTAATSLNRIYNLVAQGAAVITTSIAYTNLAGASVTTVPAGAAAMIQSNGVNWIQIN